MADEEWTDDELRSTIRAYLSMLADEVAGRPYNKSLTRRQLRAGPLFARSESAIEFRMQNISYVLAELGRTYIQGYKPATHVGSRNLERIGHLLLQHGSPSGAEAGEHKSVLRVSDVVANIDQLMGVKAVFRPLSSHVLCFGGRGDRANPATYNSLAAGAAAKAVESPFVITIGGGKSVERGLEGRVLNLAHVSTVYGPTKLLVDDPVEAARLAQWPVAIALHDVWRFVGDPHVERDLHMLDRTILSGAMDQIIAPEQKLLELWQAVEDWPLEPTRLPPPANFYDSGKPRLVGSVLPGLPKSREGREEGGRLWKLQQDRERDSGLGLEAKQLNVRRFGICTCEACGFTDEDLGMLDAHHPVPLLAGKRTSFASDLQVLCPTCHRRAHRTGNRLKPLTLRELIEFAENRKSRNI